MDAKAINYPHNKFHLKTCRRKREKYIKYSRLTHMQTFEHKSEVEILLFTIWKSPQHLFKFKCKSRWNQINLSSELLCLHDEKRPRFISGGRETKTSIQREQKTGQKRQNRNYQLWTPMPFIFISFERWTKLCRTPGRKSFSRGGPSFSFAVCLFSQTKNICKSNILTRIIRCFHESRR